MRKEKKNKKVLNPNAVREINYQRSI